MKLLIANLGSTSFKHKVFDMSKDALVLAEGKIDRIGLPESEWQFISHLSGKEMSGKSTFKDHQEAIEFQLAKLIESGCLKRLSELDGIGFKAVHGGPISGAVPVTEEVLETMREFSDVAPSHNPAYIKAMRTFELILPDIPRVASFETAFHQTIPLKRQVYAIPYEWTEQGIRKYGFHGASYRYITDRLAEIDTASQKIIVCHLGGSSSVCAIDQKRSVANSFGMTAQTGLPHGVRTGDFDTFALLRLKAMGIEETEIWEKLGQASGLLGVSGISSDLRDIEVSAQKGEPRARLAIDMFVESIRFYIGAYLTVLNGADAICFTGGIGQFSPMIREKALKGLSFAGIQLDLEKNQVADGAMESRLDLNTSKTRVWVLPTNEELVVARQVYKVLRN